MDLGQLIGAYPIASVALLSFAIIGAVKFIRSVFNKDYEAAVIIFVSALIGAALASSVDGITPLVGAIIGLNSSGIVTTADRI